MSQQYQPVVTVNELLNHYLPTDQQNLPFDKSLKQLVSSRMKNDSNKKLSQLISDITTELINELPPDVKRSTPRTTLDQFVYQISSQIKSNYYHNYNQNQINTLPVPTMKDVMESIVEQNPEVSNLPVNVLIEQFVDAFLQETVGNDQQMLNQRYPDIYRQMSQHLMRKIPPELLNKTPDDIMEQLTDRVNNQLTSRVNIANYNPDNSLGHSNSVAQMEKTTQKYVDNMTNENDINNRDNYNRNSDYYSQQNSNRDNRDEKDFITMEKDMKMPYYTEWSDNEPINNNPDNHHDNTNLPTEFKDEAQIFHDPNTNSQIVVGKNNHVFPENLRKTSTGHLPEVKIYQNPSTGQEYYYLKGYKLFMPVTRSNNIKQISNSIYHDPNLNHIIQHNNNESGDNNKNGNNNNKNGNNNNKNGNNNNKNGNNNNKNGNNNNKNGNNNNKNGNNNNKNGNNNNNGKNNNTNESGNDNNRVNKLKNIDNKTNNVDNEDDDEESGIIGFIHRNISPNIGRQLILTIIVIAILFLLAILAYIFYKKTKSVQSVGISTNTSSSSNNSNNRVVNNVAKNNVSLSNNVAKNNSVARNNNVSLSNNVAKNNATKRNNNHNTTKFLNSLSKSSPYR